MVDLCAFLPFWAESTPNSLASSPGVLLNLLVNPIFTWGLALLILGVGIVFWIRFSVFGIARAVRGVKDATTTITRRSTENQFTKNLDDIDKLLVSNPIIGRAWNHYTDSLLISPDRSSVKSGRDPQYYFNDNLLSAAGLNLRFYNAVPSYLVGLGLVCTFIGLVGALFIASMVLGQNESTGTIQMALQNLLQTAAFKFTTSVAGLGSSLIFSYATKKKLMEWQQAVDSLCDTLLDAAPVITAESLAYDALAEQRKQTFSLAQLQSDLATQIATTLDEKLRSNLIKLVEPMTEQISQVTKRLSIISQEAVTQMVQEFRTQLFAATQDQMQQLLLGLQATNGALAQMNTGIGKSADYFAQEIGRATEEVFHKITTAAQSFENSLNPLHEEIRALSDTFGKVDERFKSQLDLFTSAIESMHSTLQEFRKTAKVLEGVSTPIHNATQELDAVARRIHESNVASMHALEQLAKFSDSLNKTAQQTRETWDVYRQRFEKVDEDLKGVVDQLGRGFRNYHDIVENFMKQLDQSLSHSTRVLSSSVQELAETLENVEARTKRVER